VWGSGEGRVSWGKGEGAVVNGTERAKGGGPPTRDGGRTTWLRNVLDTLGDFRTGLPSLTQRSVVSRPSFGWGVGQ
jgi:hypothetical protein